jgi:CNT family concentrative nucleoside transporter
MVKEDPPLSSLDALVRGTADGVGPLVGITSSLLVTVSLVALVNGGIGLLPGGWTLQAVLALPFRPVMWLIGIPWEQTGAASLLMGTKTILNEFVAYLALAGLSPDVLEPHSRVIMTYAMCGFANLGSLGILVGGLAAMVPERRAEVAQLGVRSVLSGTIATCLSGAVAGVING